MRTILASRIPRFTVEWRVEGKSQGRSVKPERSSCEIVYLKWLDHPTHRIDYIS